MISKILGYVFNTTDKAQTTDKHPTEKSFDWYSVEIRVDETWIRVTGNRHKHKCDELAQEIDNNTRSLDSDDIRVYNVFDDTIEKSHDKITPIRRFDDDIPSGVNEAKRIVFY